MKTKRPGLEKVLENLSKSNSHYERSLGWQRNSRTLAVSQTMITSEGYLFGGFSCFEAAALLFCDQTPQNRFNFEISYKKPVAVGQNLILTRDSSNTKVFGSVIEGEEKTIWSSTNTPLDNSVNQPKELKESVQGIKQFKQSVVSYRASDREDLAMLFHLCCFFDRCTWLLGQIEYPYANFLTGYLSFDVRFLPSNGPLFLEAKKIEAKRKGGSSLIIEATATDSNSNAFATTECTLIRVCPETKKPLAL